MPKIINLKQAVMHLHSLCNDINYDYYILYYINYDYVCVYIYSALALNVAFYFHE